jgi:hypothetical protein
MSFVWATVTANSPLRIKLDGNDAAALPITPESLVDPLTLNTGDRVRVELHGNSNRVIVHGRSSGAPQDRGRKNACINGNFRTNQNAYVSAANIPLGTYGFDRWCAFGRVNLAFNPAARSAATGYQLVTAGAITQITGLTIAGLSGVTTAARWTSSATNTGSGILWAGSQVSPYSLVTAGQLYTLSAYVRYSTTQTVTPWASIYNSSGTLVSNASSPVTFTCTANTWTRVSMTVVMPTSSARLGLYTAAAGSMASGATVDMTGVLVEAGNTLLPYFDGTFTGCGWVSTANASNSYVGSATPTIPTLTYTSAPQGQTVTINANGHIAQFIEQANVVALASVLSWVGTSTARIYNKGTLSSALPSFAASPISFTPDGTDDLIIEFSNSGSTSTLGQVQFEVGSVATAYEYIPVSEELANCQRYFEAGYAKSYVSSANTAQYAIAVNFRVNKRVAPSMVYSNPPAAAAALPSSTEWLTVTGFDVLSGASAGQIACSWTAFADF